MPAISEKIVHASSSHLVLYKEGVFWVAYEQSAYYLSQLMGYKPTKKYVKVVDRQVVSVGFPKVEALIDELEKAGMIKACRKESNLVEIVLSQSIDNSRFEIWKTLTEGKPQKKEPTAVADIEARVKAFPLAYKTPMEAFLFLKELQDS